MVGSDRSGEKIGAGRSIDDLSMGSGRNTLGPIRLHQLDGLRGVAALIVVVFHYFSAFVPHLISDRFEPSHWLADSPISIFFNGPFFVTVFFVLSGFVVSRSVRTPKAPFIALTALRYLRLTIPALVSVIFAWMFLTLAPRAASDLAADTGNKWLTYTYNGDIPSLVHAIYEGTVSIYTLGDSHFNNVLWTIKIELIGSILIYISYSLFQPRYRLLVLFFVCSVATIVFHNSGYVAFLLGALLQEVWTARRLPRIAPYVFVIVGSLIGSQAAGFSERMGLTFIPSPLQPGNRNGLLYPIGATFIVYGLLVAPQLSKIFSSSLCLFLGRISFGLYLIHVPLLVTAFTSIAFLLQPLSPALLAVGLPVVLFTGIVAGWLMTIFIDEPLLRLLLGLRRLTEAALSPSACHSKSPPGLGRPPKMICDETGK